MGSKFRVKANFLLAEQLGLRTMMLLKTHAFQEKPCGPGKHISSGEHNVANKAGEDKGRQ